MLSTYCIFSFLKADRLLDFLRVLRWICCLRILLWTIFCMVKAEQIDEEIDLTRRLLLATFGEY